MQSPVSPSPLRFVQKRLETLFLETQGLRSGEGAKLRALVHVVSQSQWSPGLEVQSTGLTRETLYQKLCF